MKIVIFRKDTGPSWEDLYREVLTGLDPSSEVVTVINDLPELKRLMEDGVDGLVITSKLILAEAVPIAETGRITWVCLTADPETVEGLRLRYPDRPASFVLLKGEEGVEGLRLQIRENFLQRRIGEGGWGRRFKEQEFLGL